VSTCSVLSARLRSCSYIKRNVVPMRKKKIKRIVCVPLRNARVDRTIATTTDNGVDYIGNDMESVNTELINAISEYSKLNFRNIQCYRVIKLSVRKVSS